MHERRDVGQRLAGEKIRYSLAVLLLCSIFEFGLLTGLGTHGHHISSYAVMDT